MVISLLGGKYEIIKEFDKPPFVFKALRHGEEWQNLIGNKLVLALVQRIEELEGQQKDYMSGKVEICEDCGYNDLMGCKSHEGCIKAKEEERQ